MSIRLAALLILLTPCAMSTALATDPVFYVCGAVHEPGAFSLPQDRVLTVKEAVAMAGGPKRDARPADCVLVRFQKSGSRSEQQINLEAILLGKQPDLPIQAKDIIFVPGSRTKPDNDIFDPLRIREPFDGFDGPSDEVIDPPWLKRAEL